MAWPDGDRDTGQAVRGFLRSRANTIEGGTSEIMRNIIGYWGQVLVPLAEVVRARALVDDYLKTLERRPPKDPRKDAEDADGAESAGGEPSSS